MRPFRTTPDIVKRREISTHPSRRIEYTPRRCTQSPESVFLPATQGPPISLINDMRFVMRILGVATARCAKLKLRCLIYRRRESDAREGAHSCRRKINCDLLEGCGAGRPSGKRDRGDAGMRSGIEKNSCPARRHSGTEKLHASHASGARTSREKARRIRYERACCWLEDAPSESGMKNEGESSGGWNKVHLIYPRNG